MKEDRQRELFIRAAPCPDEIEYKALERGYKVIIGVDEAGRGPLAGPVYAAAVAIDLQALNLAWIQELNDSKKLSEKRREVLFDKIKTGATAYAVSYRDSQNIDKINILEATREAMKEAVEAVGKALSSPVDAVFIDGKQFLDIDYHQVAVIGGDGRSRSIAAASILAKVSRDKLMADIYGKTWPAYGFAKHKGYGTKMHREAIKTHGPCTIHRLSFGGVKEYKDRLINNK